MKKITMFIIMLIGLTFSLSVMNVNAAPSTIQTVKKSKMYYFSEKNKSDYINGYNFYRKELTDGSLAYCASNINTKVPSGVTLTLKGENQDMGLNYIIQNGYPNKSFTGDEKKDYYITQATIWAYYDATRGSSNWKKNTFTSSSTGMKKNVYTLLQEALNARNTSYPTPSMSLVYLDKSLTLKNGYFVSNPVKVNLTNTTGVYTVSLENAPTGTVIKDKNGNVKTSFNNGEEFVLYVPSSAISTLKGEVKVKVLSVGLVKKTYIYTINNKEYQDIIPREYEEKKDLSEVLVFNYEKEPNKVKISKQDITTKKELPGATLVVKDKDGKEIDKWVSTNEPHYIENLKPGKYTLTEKIAPDGYVLSKETVTFTVKDDGSVTEVVMYNTKKEVTKLKISKQDITTKKELPGATLILKDKNDKEIDKWVSTNEPHYIEGLEEGEYILTEIIAPNGYVLSKETIKFTLEANGSVKEVVMYNTKTTIVKISKQDVTTKKELPGATLVVKNKNDKEVDRWVSTNEPHYIEGLEEGEYTLTEVIAPDGYVLSEETIKFTVKADGSVTEVVMYNTLYEVPITDLNVNQTLMIIAAVLVLMGTGLVVYYAKFSK